MWLYGRMLQIVCNHPAGLEQVLWQWRYNVFNLSRDLICRRVEKVPIVSHHFVRFTGHRPCGGSDTSAKMFYLTLQAQVIEGSGDFWK